MATTNNERVPSELDCTNLATEWQIWKRNFMVYMISSGKSAQAETTKIATFIWLVGTQGANIYNSIFPNDGTTDALLGTQNTVRQVPAVVARPAADGNPAVAAVPAREENVVVQRTLDEVLQAFDRHCIPQKNVAMESYKFNGIMQKEKQSFAEFETELRTQLRRCEFSCTCGVSFGDRMLRDRIITGVFDKKLQLKLLDGRDEALTRVIEVCKTFEAANANKGILHNKPTVSSIVTSSESTVYAINRASNQYCYNCGDQWTPKHAEVCKAKGQTCKCCSKIGHFQRMCRQKSKKSYNNNNSSRNNSNNNGGGSNAKQNISSVNWGDQNGESLVNNKSLTRTQHDGNKTCKSFIFRINSVNAKWTKEYIVGDRLSEGVTFKLDSGSDANCIPLLVVRKLKVPISNRNNNYTVFDYNNNLIKIYGTVELKCTDRKTGSTHFTEFIVVSNENEPILGLNTCREWKLIKRMDIDTVDIISCTSGGKQKFVEQNWDLFHGTGKFPGKFSIHLKTDSKPILHYKKRIPLALQEKL